MPPPQRSTAQPVYRPLDAGEFCLLEPKGALAHLVSFELHIRAQLRQLLRLIRSPSESQHAPITAQTASSVLASTSAQFRKATQLSQTIRRLLVQLEDMLSQVSCTTVSTSRSSNTSHTASASSSPIGTLSLQEDDTEQSMPLLGAARIAALSIEEQLREHSLELHRLRTWLREANAEYANAMEAQYQNDRELLLSGGVLPTELRRRQKADALKLEAQVTSSLQSMRDTMATEIQRGDATLQVLEHTSNQLRSAMAEHEDLSDSVKRSERLLATRRRRDRTDALLLRAGVAFFFLVVAYIVKSRIFG